MSGQSSASADNLNVKLKFSESGSDIHNNQNECFGVSESISLEILDF